MPDGQELYSAKRVLLPTLHMIGARYQQVNRVLRVPEYQPRLALTPEALARAYENICKQGYRPTMGSGRGSFRQIEDSRSFSLFQYVSGGLRSGDVHCSKSLHLSIEHSKSAVTPTEFELLEETLERQGVKLAKYNFKVSPNDLFFEDVA